MGGMTELNITHAVAAGPADRVVSPNAIGVRLAMVGVGFERIPMADVPPDPDATQDEVIEAYREPLNRLMHRYQFVSVDVVGLSPEHPLVTARRRELASTHCHQVAEGRLIVNGRVIFGLHAGSDVYALHCSPGDFIALPAGMKHWLRTGDPPNFRSVRLFTATAAAPALPRPRVDAHARLLS